MKIVLIAGTFLPVHDGISLTMFERLKRLSETGHSVLCLVPSYAEIAHIFPDWSDYVGHMFPQVKVVALPSKKWMGIEQERNPRRKSLSIINSALADFRPDIIQVEEPERLWSSLLTLPGLSYAQEQKIPYVCGYQTNYIDYVQDYVPTWLAGMAKTAATLFTRWIYNQSSITLVGSQFSAQRLISWGIKNVSYVETIGPLPVHHPENLKKSDYFSEFHDLPEVDKTVKILFLGRLYPDKNWEFNCKYLQALKAKPITNEFTILVAGRGILEASIRSSDFAQKIPTVMLGEVHHEKISQLLANVDIHVTSSLCETFGRTVQESLGVGTPVVAPDCEWARNLIQPEYNGVLYKAEDGADFIDKLATLIDNSNIRRQLSKNALSKKSAKDDPAITWIEYLQEIIILSKNRIS